ncbi:MAG: hypothetical protein QXQ41_05590, partial [Candidatus Bathyarchaeia archaeon]
MWIASLSLIGVPPLSGFWSKDGILLSCLESGQYLLFALAAITVAVTSFYVIRFMSIVFHSNSKTHEKHVNHSSDHSGEAPKLMLLPYGILAILTVAIGLLGPWMKEALSEIFLEEFHALNLPVSGSLEHNAPFGLGEGVPIIVSLVMMLIGGFPAYSAYFAKKLDVGNLLKKYAVLRHLHGFLWNRWYMDGFFNKVFVNSILASREPTAKYVEKSMDTAINVGIPKFFSLINANIRKIQTGVFSVNMLYILMFLVALLLIFILQGVI